MPTRDAWESYNRTATTFAPLSNSQGVVSLKCHSFVEFAFAERNLGDLGLRI